jgi:putative DNA primase/helicase
MGKPESKPHARVTRLSDVTAEEIEWLWPGRVPLGKLSMFSGDPGLGKSYVSIYVAAMVTTGGAWPGSPGEPNPVGSVVLVSCEDGLADTIKPRLEAAGGDPSKVISLDGVDTIGSDGETISRPFNLSDDLAMLEQVLIDNPDTRLVIVDPVGAYGGKADTHNDAAVRGMLAPLGELAERYRVAVVMVGHMSKAKNSNPLYKSMGSIAYVAASRAVWLFFKDQDDPKRRLILLGKLNIAKEPMGLAYRITDDGVDWESDPVKMTAAEYVAQENQAPERQGGTEQSKAGELLLQWLECGPLESSSIDQLAADEGISRSSLHRAKERLGIKAKKVGKVWQWSLPAVESVQDSTDSPTLAS